MNCANTEGGFASFSPSHPRRQNPSSGGILQEIEAAIQTRGSEVVTFCHGLKLMAPDGKFRKTDCANTEGLFRILQSSPSPKAEPFKRWLAKVGYEPVPCIRRKAILMTGLKSECAALPSERNLQVSGKTGGLHFL